MIKRDEDFICAEVSVNYTSAKAIQWKGIQKNVFVSSGTFLVSFSHGVTLSILRGFFPLEIK